MGTFILKFVDEKERFLRLDNQTLDITLLSGANGEEGKEVVHHYFQQAVEGLPEEEEVGGAGCRGSGCDVAILSSAQSCHLVLQQLQSRSHPLHLC